MKWGMAWHVGWFIVGIFVGYRVAAENFREYLSRIAEDKFQIIAVIVALVLGLGIGFLYGKGII